MHRPTVTPTKTLALLTALAVFAPARLLAQEATPAPTPTVGADISEYRAVSSALAEAVSAIDEGRADDALRILDRVPKAHRHPALGAEVTFWRFEAARRIAGNTDASRLALDFCLRFPKHAYRPQVDRWLTETLGASSSMYVDPDPATLWETFQRFVSLDSIGAAYALMTDDYKSLYSLEAFIPRIAKSKAEILASTAGYDGRTLLVTTGARSVAIGVVAVPGATGATYRLGFPLPPSP
jgi:hypothetical protein